MCCRELVPRQTLLQLQFTGNRTAVLQGEPFKAQRINTPVEGSCHTIQETAKTTTPRLATAGLTDWVIISFHAIITVRKKSGLCHFLTGNDRSLGTIPLEPESSELTLSPRRPW